MSLTIKNFSVLNTTTGKMQISGRYTLSQTNNILSHSTITNNVTENVAISGTPTTINSNEGLYQKAHMCSVSFKIISENQIIGNNNIICVLSNIIRLVYVGGNTSASNSLIYAFSSKIDTSIFNMTWNVIIAKNTSQTIGDYFDIILPDRTFYPHLYISFIMLNSAWDNKIIVNDNVCSITNINTPNFCITPSQSSYDVNQSHFIVCQGTNNNNGICSRITVACEDWHMSITDRDYNDFIFSICDKGLSESLMNDTHVS